MDVPKEIFKILMLSFGVGKHSVDKKNYSHWNIYAETEIRYRYCDIQKVSIYDRYTEK